MKTGKTARTNKSSDTVCDENGENCEVLDYPAQSFSDALEDFVEESAVAGEDMPAEYGDQFSIHMADAEFSEVRG